MKTINRFLQAMTIGILFTFCLPVQAQVGSGTAAANDIIESFKNADTRGHTSLKNVVKEVQEAAKKAGEANPDDAQAVKDAVKQKLQEIRDRRGTSKKPGGKNNADVLKFVQQFLPAPRDAIRGRIPSSRPSDSRLYVNMFLSGAYNLSGPQSQIINGEALYQHLNTPTLSPYLSETFSGTIVPGVLQNGEVVDMQSSGKNYISPGLGIGLGINSGLEIGMQVHAFRSELNGSFPVTFYPFSTGRPHSFQGTINSSASGIMADAEARYFLTRGSFQPYLLTGLRGQWALNSQSSVNLKGILLPVESSIVNYNTWSAYGGFGFRNYFGSNAFVQSAVSFGATSTGNLNTDLSVGLGWKFGGNRPRINPIPIPVEISVVNKYCECGNVTFKTKVIIDFPLAEVKAEGNVEFDSGNKMRDTIKPHQVVHTYEVGLEITDLIMRCTECNKGSCDSDLVSIKIKSSQMEDDSEETLKPNDDGKYSLPARMVARLSNARQKPEDNPAKFIITIVYNCERTGCDKRTCTSIFEIVIPRRK